MKRLLCCFKGEGTCTPVQQPQLPNALKELFPSSPPLPVCAESFAWQAIVEGALNFEETLKLGQGNFGKVYRCNFPSIKKVGAAKIHESKNQASHLAFIAEVTMLHEVDHPNVIKLLGQCNEPRHRALVYEFMPNGSLDDYLVEDSQVTRVLRWETRMKIAVGVAQGLAYVHKTLKAVHRDITAGNILLDHNFVPKLSDFGLAIRIIEGEGGLEKESTFMSAYNVTANNVLVDAGVRNRFSVKGFKDLLFITWMCLGEYPDSRPTMDQVEDMILAAAAWPIQEDSIASSSTYKFAQAV